MPNTPGSPNVEHDTARIGNPKSTGVAARTAVAMRRHRTNHEVAIPKNPAAQIVSRTVESRLPAATGALKGSLTATITADKRDGAIPAAGLRGM
jgi:hypothetical protein